MEKINWGIIGLGRIANIFANSFKNVNNSNLVAVASKNKKRLNIFKEKYEIDNEYAFNDYNELINCNKVDIVYIALPHNLHSIFIKNCIKSNKNILVEKPATITSTQIIEINKLLNNKKLFFAEAFMYLFHPQTELLLKLIKDKKIGDVTQLETQFGFNIIKKSFLRYIKSMFFKEDRLLNKSLGGGSMLDIGCYTTSFSILLSKLKNDSDIKKLKIYDKKLLLNNSGVDIEVSATLDFCNGFKSKIFSSFKKNLSQISVIKGTSGEIVIKNSWHCEPSKIVCNGKEYNVENNIYKNVYSYEIDKVSRCILNGRSSPEYPAFNRLDSENNMKIIDRLIYEK